MKFKNTLWGLLLVGGAVMLILSGLGIFPEIGFFKLISSIFFVFLLLGGIKELSWGGILFPLAFLGIIWSHELGIDAITPWPILGAALLGSIGLSMLIKKKHHIKCYVNGKEEKFEYNFKKEKVVDVDSFVEYDEDEADSTDGEHFNTSIVFGSKIRYVDSQNFESGDLECVFSNMKLYFDHASLKNGTAVVSGEEVFSKMEIYVPKEWKVVDNLQRVGGSYRQVGSSIDAKQVLYLKGEMVFSSLTVFYI